MDLWIFLGDTVIRKFKKNNEGMIAIEFAFYAPLLMLMSMLIIESALILFYQTAVDDALSSSVRSSKTTLDNREDIIEEIKTKFKESAFGIPDKDSLIITTDIAVNFDAEYEGTGDICYDADNIAVGVGTGIGIGCTDGVRCETNGDGICDAPTPPLALGGPGDVVTILAVYKWKSLTPGIGFFFPEPAIGENRNFNNTLIANEDGDHLIVSGMTYRNEE